MPADGMTAPFTKPCAVEGQVADLDGFLHHFSKDSIAHYVETMNRYTTLEAAEAFKRNPLPSRWPVPVIFRSFFHRYIYMESYREGVFGLLMSLMFAFYSYLTWAKHWELAKNAGIIPGQTRPRWLREWSAAPATAHGGLRRISQAAYLNARGG